MLRGVPGRQDGFEGQRAGAYRYLLMPGLTAGCREGFEGQRMPSVSDATRKDVYGRLVDVKKASQGAGKDLKLRGCLTSPCDATQKGCLRTLGRCQRGPGRQERFEGQRVPDVTS